MALLKRLFDAFVVHISINTHMGYVIYLSFPTHSTHGPNIPWQVHFAGFISHTR